jgi:hypothetical protein
MVMLGFDELRETNMVRLVRWHGESDWLTS